MEGISHEACALAGTWKLGKLIAFYDDNGISIDGAVDGWFTDDTAKRFRAYGWQVVDGVDGHDVEAVDRAIDLAKSDGERPTLIVCKTAIGKGAPTRAGTAKAHGEPLGADEIAATRQALDWHARAVRDSGRHRARMGCARSRRGAAERLGSPFRSLLRRVFRTPAPSSCGDSPANCRAISRRSRPS